MPSIKLYDFIFFESWWSVVAMSSSQYVNRGRACIVANRDYSEYYMRVHVVCQVTFLCSFQGIINNYPIKQLCTPNVFV